MFAEQSFLVVEHTKVDQIVPDQSEQPHTSAQDPVLAYNNMETYQPPESYEQVFEEPSL